MDTRSLIENPGNVEEPARESTEPRTEADETVVPVIAEELVAGTKAVTTGTVRVHKRVHERTEHVDMPVVRDVVDIKRVTVNRVVDRPPQIRTVGETIIVPVVEEEIVVTKRMVLKEELHLVRRRATSRASGDVTVRRETAQVERLDADGRPVPARVTRPVARRRNSIIPDH
jgi:uncharacterized protein (TIGR02271 family)